MWVAEVVIESGGEPIDTSRAGIIMFGAFLLSFGFIRMSTRLMRSPKVPWWPGSIKPGGLHIHHLVFGIVLLLICGFLAIALQPDGIWLDVLAAGFGIGAGLTLDEFALWLHLDDVYWSDEGRKSVDAVLIAALVGGLVLCGLLPLTNDGGASFVSVLISGLIIIALSVISMLKGKYVLGLVGLFIPFVSLAAAIRIAKPHTPWARWIYKEGGRKRAKSEKRFERHTERLLRWQDRIGGAPDKPSPYEQQP